MSGVRLGQVAIEETDVVTDFAIEGMRPETTSMVVSRQKVRCVVEHFARSTSDFNLLAWRGNELVAGIAVAVIEMLWFERCEAHIVMFRSKAPGVGRSVLRRAMEWCMADMRIKRVLWSLEADVDARTARFAARYGFNPQTLCVMEKG